MKNSLLIKAISIGMGGVILLFLFMFIVTPSWVSGRLTREMSEVCKTCVIRWDSLDVTLVPLGGVINGVSLRWGEPRTTQVDVSIRSVLVDLSGTALWRGRLSPNNISFLGPKVVVIEGDEKTPRSKDETSEMSRSRRNPKIEITDGVFVYERAHLGKKGKKVGKIHLSEIRAVGNRLKVELSALLERSGRVNLGLRFPDMSNPFNVDISLDLSSFDMNNVNQYFSAVEGMRLAGNILSSQSTAILRGHQLTAWVRARYKGLKLDFIKTEDRGTFSADLSTFLSHAKIESDRTQEVAQNPATKVEVNRHGEETILSFIIRGLKEAALLELSG